MLEGCGPDASREAEHVLPAVLSVGTMAPNIVSVELDIEIQLLTSFRVWLFNDLGSEGGEGAGGLLDSNCQDDILCSTSRLLSVFL